ncbi:MAG: hypothetical protein IJ729_01365 [Alloprevotella sp.]|nr:hypothetical protein [Alloprevotella sp.]
MKKAYTAPRFRIIKLHSRDGLAGFVIGSDGKETDDQWTRKKNYGDGASTRNGKLSLWDDIE